MTGAVRWRLTSAGTEPQRCPLWVRSLLLFAASQNSVQFYTLKTAVGERARGVPPSCPDPFYGHRYILALWDFLRYFVEGGVIANVPLYVLSSCWHAELGVGRLRDPSMVICPLEHGTANEHSPSSHTKDRPSSEQIGNSLC